MTRRIACVTLLTLCVLPATALASVRIGVFGLFKPRDLVVRSGDGRGLTVRSSGDTCTLRGRDEAQLVVANGSVQASCGRMVTGRVLRITSLTGADSPIELSVPGKIARTFRGRVDVTEREGSLVPVVTMDLETAVAAVVAAEQVDATPLEALKAQAVAARSYMVASRGRHQGFDFCDTTHCQFLREPPDGERAAARAARETIGLVLTFRDVPIAALYSANCGGHTRSLVEAGLLGTSPYPYFAVACAHSPRHDGQPAGHGVGLCQVGAAALASENGASFRDILSYYYPGTTLTSRSR